MEYGIKMKCRNLLNKKCVPTKILSRASAMRFRKLHC